MAITGAVRCLLAGALATAAFAFDLEQALACGGPTAYTLSTDIDARSLYQQFAFEPVDPYDYELTAELQFFTPFDLHPPPEPDRPSTDIHSALRARSAKLIREAATSRAQGVIDLPQDEAPNDSLIMAAEAYELANVIGKLPPDLVESFFVQRSEAALPLDAPRALVEASLMRKTDRPSLAALAAANPKHVRRATLLFVAMQEHFKTGVRDGWSHDAKIPDETWARLHAEVKTWLAEFPKHPLADLVRLWDCRISYFQGDYEHAWQILLEQYPRHPLRALHEMRYLVLRGERLNDSQFDAIADPTLLATLAPYATFSRERWDRLWKRSERLKTPDVRLNTQERLLWFLNRSNYAWRDQLPSRFPERPDVPSTLWAALRATALMMAGRLDDAAVQIAALPSDMDRTSLQRALCLLRDDIVCAAEVDGIEPHLLRYFIEIAATDDELAAFAKAKNKEIRALALRTRAIRAAANGDWIEGARHIERVSPNQAALWRKAATLSVDATPTGRLAWARFLRQHNGEIFYPFDRVWYRSVSSAARVVSGPSIGGAVRRDAAPAAQRYLTTTNEDWVAFLAYADWLRANAEPTKKAREILAEADDCYNRLVNLDPAGHHFWGEYLASQPEVAVVRDAGRTIRTNK